MTHRIRSLIVIGLLVMVPASVDAKLLDYWKSTYQGEVLEGPTPDDVAQKVEPIANSTLPDDHWWNYKFCRSGTSNYENFSYVGLICDRVVMYEYMGYPAGYNLNGNDPRGVYMISAGKNVCPENPTFDDPLVCQHQCDCEEDLVNGACVARDVVEWLEPVFSFDNSVLSQFTTPNSEGVVCGRETEIDSCPVEAPIQGREWQGNPIACTTGQKVQTEVDYQSPSGNLTISRTYKSRPRVPEGRINTARLTERDHESYVQWHNWVRVSAQPTDLYSWRFNLPRLINFGNDVLAFDNGSGSLRYFYKYKALSEEDNDLSFDGTTTIYRSPLGTEYQFDTARRIVKKQFNNGQFQDFLYPNSEQLVIRDNFGREVTLNYQNASNYAGVPARRVASMVDPAGRVTQYQYDQNNMIASVQYPDANSVTYAYDVAHDAPLLIGKTDELGNPYAQWQYDELNRGTLSEHAGQVGRVEIEYQDPSDPNSISANARVKTFRTASQTLLTDYEFKKINGANKPIKIRDLGCYDCRTGTTHYRYDGNGYLSEIEIPGGSKTGYSYNARGLLSQLTEAKDTPQARATTINWHPDFAKPVSIIEPGRHLEYEYDADGNLLVSRLLNAVNGTAAETTYTYNQIGQVLSVDGPRTDVDDISTFTYNGLGNLVTVTNALGHTTTVTHHDAYGKPTRMVDANGLVTQMAYHPRGWLTELTVDGDATQYDYNAAGLLQSLTLPNGVQLHYDYNAAQQLTAIEDGQGNRIEYTVDLHGNRSRTELKDPNGTLKSYLDQSFNNVGQLIKTTRYWSASYSAAYNFDGTVANTTDPHRQVTNYLYDDLDRLSQSIDPLGQITNYEYTHEDEIAKVTDATGLSTTYSRNGLGQVISRSSPDTGIQTYDYDLAGNLIQHTDARGVITTTAYDALNRPTLVTFSGSSDTLAYEYDDTHNGNAGIGRLTAIIEANGTNRFTYDVKGQLVQHQQEINTGATTAVFNSQFQYDNAGLLTQVTTPTGRLLNYGHNGAGQLVSLSTQANANASDQPLASNLTYLPFGPLSQLTYGNGKQLNNTYDQSYRLSRRTITGVSNASYNYSYRHNITYKNDTLNPPAEYFSYDRVERLIRAYGDYGTKTYTFDGIGNRQTEGHDGVDDTFSYANTGHQLLLIALANTPTPALTYDAAGNTLTKGELTFTYDQQGRLQTASKPGMSATYAYNSQHLRISKTVNGVTTLYLYDTNGNLIAEANDQGQIQKEYVYVNDQRLAMIDGHTIYYIHSNHLDAPIAVTDQSGTLQWKAKVQPYGNTDIAIENVTMNFRFPGQYYDSETGLFYNWHRYYDPETGRYVTSDPMGLSDGPNTYAYVGANPVNYTDPDGLYRRGMTSIGAACAQNPFYCSLMAGGAIDGGVNVAGQVAEKGWNCVDWGEAAGATGRGMLWGAGGYGVGLGIAKYGGGLLAGLGRGFGGMVDDVTGHGLEATRVTRKGIDRIEKHLTKTPGSEGTI